jgi:hypothetical protein
MPILPTVSTVQGATPLLKVCDRIVDESGVPDALIAKLTPLHMVDTVGVSTGVTGVLFT